MNEDNRLLVEKMRYNLQYFFVFPSFALIVLVGL